MIGLVLLTIFMQVKGPAPVLNFDKPLLLATGIGYGTTSVKASTYEIILYADTYAEDENSARDKALAVRNQIKKIASEYGVKEEDIQLTNFNSLQPVADDPYYRVEQDLKISFKKPEKLSQFKSKILEISGVQIGSITPVIKGTTDYGPAIKKARKEAINSAYNEAKELAKGVGVLLGEPVFITEDINYPTYTGYEAPVEAKIKVKVSIYYNIIYKK